jgi:uncharacterized membrane protein
MTVSHDLTSELPPDPSFPPVAFERIAGLLRVGILGFLLFAGAGMVLQLVLNPFEDVSSVLASNPLRDYGSWGAFFSDLASGHAAALIILGIYVLVAVTIGRVLLATVDFYRGGERTLGQLSAIVVVLLLVGLFVVAPFVH